MINRFFIASLTVMISASMALTEETTTANFTLEDMDGEFFTLQEHLGSGPVLIDFWATWCKPCKDAMPHLQALHEKYGEEGLTVIAISTDSPKSLSKVKPYIRSKKYSFTVLYDPGSEVLKQFQGQNIPYRVLLDKDGNVVETHVGYSPGDEKLLEASILELMKTDEEE